MTNIIGIIPARMDSTRFPNKPMKHICGMPMIGHCLKRTSMALGKENTYVATCDKEIYDYVKSIGGNSIMTSQAHTRASTRTAEALKIIEKNNTKVDIIIMIQGDEPLVHPRTIDNIKNSFTSEDINIVNVMTPIKSDIAFKDYNNVKVVVNKSMNALYFSREPIPSAWNNQSQEFRYMQTGLIGFRRESLLNFNEMDETNLEIIESVDMNRVLEMGFSVKMIASKETNIGVDVPSELKDVEDLMINDDLFKEYKT
tara:strand:+ start:6860 stop:7627 length:768 start_codon:yes stop_codon:yes gene_type:complete